MFSDAAETLGLGAVSAGTLALGILCPLLWIGAFVSGYFNKHFFQSNLWAIRLPHFMQGRRARTSYRKWRPERVKAC